MNISDLRAEFQRQADDLPDLAALTAQADRDHRDRQRRRMYVALAAAAAAVVVLVGGITLIAGIARPGADRTATDVTQTSLPATELSLSQSSSSAPVSSTGVKGIAIDGSITIVGTDNWVRIEDDSPVAVGCKGAGSYADVKEGGPITIANGEGTVLATGTLEEGIIGGVGESECFFSMLVVNVPAGESAYVVSVDGHEGFPAERDANSDLLYHVSAVMGS